MLRHYHSDEENYKEYGHEIEILYCEVCPHKLQYSLNYEEVTHDLLIERMRGKRGLKKRATGIINTYRKQLFDIGCYRRDGFYKKAELYTDR